MLRTTHGFECDCARCAARERYNGTRRRWETAAEYAAAAAVNEAASGVRWEEGPGPAGFPVPDSEAALDETVAYLAFLAELGRG